MELSAPALAELTILLLRCMEPAAKSVVNVPTDNAIPCTSLDHSSENTATNASASSSCPRASGWLVESAGSVMYGLP